MDFGSSSFGFVDRFSLGVEDPRREQDASEEKSEEIEQITRASSPLGLSLDSRLVPDGMGALEQISYEGGRKISSPAAVFPSYLFFDVSIQRTSIPYENPKYLVYSHLVPHDAALYVGRYLTPDSLPEYFATHLYGPAERPKLYLPAADFSTPYVAPYSLLDSREQSYQRFVWNMLGVKPKTPYKGSYRNENLQAAPLAARLEAPAGMPAYTINPLQDALQNTPLHTEKKPIVFVQSSDPDVLHQQHVSMQPKQIAVSYNNGIPKIQPQIRETRTTYKNPATLDADVRNAYLVQNTSLHQASPSVYYPVLFSARTDFLQNNQAGEPKLEAKIRDIQVQNNSYEKSQALQIYTPVNPARNYDMPAPWINIPSSVFWQSSGIYSGKLTANGNNAVANQHVHEPGKTPKEKLTKNSKYKKADGKIAEDTPVPKYEERREIKSLDRKDDAKKQIKPKYEPKNKEETKETEASDTDAEIPYQNVNNKETYDGKNNAATYFKTAAAIGAGAALMGLLGFANLASAFVDKPVEVKKDYSYQVTNNNTEEPRKQEAKTIDSVVAPVVAPASSDDKKIIFTQEFKTDLTSLIINEAKELGYDFSAMSLIKNSTGEYIGIGEDKKPKEGPSINKVAIAFAAGYLAQQRLINLEELKIDFNPERDKDCILARELERYAIFKQKGQIGYNQLRELMLRESVNTAANILLKYIGDGNRHQGKRAVEKVMGETNLNDIKISGYLAEEKEYLDGKTSTENAARLQSYISQGKYLKPEYLNPIKLDLENERHLEFLRAKFGNGSGTKITFLKEGTGFAFYFGDYSGAVLFNDPKKPLWNDMVKDAMGIRRFETQTMSATRKLFGKVADTLQKYLIQS